MRRLLVALAFLCVAALPLAAEEWRFDVVQLKSGMRFEGLIHGETPDAIHFKHVSRRPGKPTLVLETVFRRDEIDKIERLEGTERQELAKRVDQIDRRVELEKKRMQALALERVAWPSGGQAWRHAGKHFVLVSNMSNEELVRLIVVRLEDIFQAFTENLGARRQPAQPTSIVLYRSLAEYAAALKGRSLNIFTPAFYDPARNEIVAASDLERLSDELAKLKAKHEGYVKELDAYEAKLKRHFHDNPPPAMLAQLRQMRLQIPLLNKENESTLERQVRPLFTTLYHEAFHAYLDNFVYASSETPVPRWLNEGLAQIFETALVETGDLRVGHVDPKRLADVQAAIKNKQFVPLAELLAADAQPFLAAHKSEVPAASRYFQASWALAYYLKFETKALADEALNEYLRGLAGGRDRIQGFERLVGASLKDFEPRFQQYLLHLRPDGTVRSPKP
jgi:hypothetical protein